MAMMKLALLPRCRAAFMPLVLTCALSLQISGCKLLGGAPRGDAKEDAGAKAIVSETEKYNEMGAASI